MFASGFAFCSFVIGCDNPTYNLSSISLFIILVELFFTNKRASHWFYLVFGCKDLWFWLATVSEEVFSSYIVPTHITSENMTVQLLNMKRNKIFLFIAVQDFFQWPVSVKTSAWHFVIQVIWQSLPCPDNSENFQNKLLLFFIWWLILEEDIFCQYLKLNFHIKAGYCLIRLTKTPLKWWKMFFISPKKLFLETFCYWNFKFLSKIFMLFRKMGGWFQNEINSKFLTPNPRKECS